MCWAPETGLDSQIENFLAHYGLLDFARRNNLSVRSKLEFLEKTGLLPGRALRRFNAVRNRIEHEFERPNLPDLEVLLDLGVAVVSVLELTALLVPAEADAKYKIYEGTVGASPEIGIFALRYTQNPPLFVVGWDIGGESKEFKIGPRQQDEFAYLFRVYALLHRRFYDLAGDIKIML